MVYDPTASVPAVLLAKNYVSSSTTYMYNVREPDGWLLCSFDASETPNKYYYHFDNLGSTVLVTNGSGTVSDSFTYGAWGDVLNSPTGNRYQYVGQLGYYAHTTAQGTALADLMQLGVRAYDLDLGRFLQRDPIPAFGSCYEYVGDNPLYGVDPDGLTKKVKKPKPPIPGQPRKPKVPKPKPLPKPKPTPGKPGKIGPGIIGAGVTGGCAAGAILSISQDCGFFNQWSCDCVCDSWYWTKKGLEEATKGAPWYKRPGWYCVNLCADAVADVVDRSCACDQF
jgi:RHS repeat-associated protein